MSMPALLLIASPMVMMEVDGASPVFGSTRNPHQHPTTCTEHGTRTGDVVEGQGAIGDVPAISAS